MKRKKKKEIKTANLDSEEWVTMLDNAIAENENLANEPAGSFSPC